MCFNFRVYELIQRIVVPAHAMVGWLVVLRIYVALAVFQPYRDLEAGDISNQSLKFKWRGRDSNPRPLALQAKS